MSEETLDQRSEDALEHKNSYDAVMGASTRFGVPFALALATFFTSLVMANGFIISVFAGLIVHLFTFIVVKMFFSH